VTHTFRARLDALLEQDNDLQKKHDRAVDDANRVAGDVAKTLSMNLSSDRAALVGPVADIIYRLIVGAGTGGLRTDVVTQIVTMLDDAHISAAK